MNGSLTYFKDGWGGTHSFKVGGEFQHEQQRYSTTAFGPSSVILYMTNNRPTQADVYLVPNATRAVGRSKSVYLTDNWRVNSRLTFNLGYRFDQYTNYVPEQVGPQGHEFPQIEAPTWNLSAPRVGGVYALTDDQKTLIKASYGMYWENPGFTLANQGNPNPNNNFTKYESDQSDADLQPGRAADLRRTSAARPGALRLGRARRLLAGGGLRSRPEKPVHALLVRVLRAGDRRQLRRADRFRLQRDSQPPHHREHQPAVRGVRPADRHPKPGPDGALDTADDGAAVTAYNLDPAFLPLPVVQVVKNGYVTNSDFYTWESHGDAAAVESLVAARELLQHVEPAGHRQPDAERVGQYDRRSRRVHRMAGQAVSNLQMWKGHRVHADAARTGRPSVLRPPSSPG